MAQENNASQQLYDLLVTRDLDPKSLDSMGKPTVNPSEADLFSFNFKTENKEYGTVVVLVNGDNDLELFYGDNLGKGMDSGDKGDWYDFLSAIRNLAKRHLLTFSLNNMNKLKYQMKSMADLAEGLVLEGWKGQGKNKSYNNQPGNAKVVIQHSRAIGEGEQRFRNIGALFVENAQGERFKMPFSSIGGAKAMARHVSEGGNPYDSFGQHISEIVNEINTLGKFIRASRGNQFAQNQQALSIVEDAVKHYSELKRKAKKMIGKRGYKEIFSTYDPMVVTELDETVEAVREVFVNSTVDSRIEEALPILAKIKENKMKEADIFEQWADGLMEGTWQLPSESEETFAKFTELMAQPIKAGPGGEYASELLYDVFGDDSLFDEIGDLGDKDPEADVRDLIRARAEELDIVLPAEAEEVDVEVGESIVENPTDQETARGYQAGQANAAAGKERSMAMNLGGEKAAVKQTAGGQDIEEDYRDGRDPVMFKGQQIDTDTIEYDMQDFSDMIFVLEDGVRYTDGSPVADEDYNDLHEADDIIDYVSIDYMDNQAPQYEGMDNFVNPNDQDGTDDANKISNREQSDLDSEDMTEDRLPRAELDIDDDEMANLMSADELRNELIDDLNHLYDQASANDFTDNDHIVDEMGDYFNDMHINGDDDVVEVYTMARDLVDEDPAVVIQMTEKGIKGLGGIIEDAAMSDLRRLSGQVNEAKSPPEVINPTKDSSPADLKAAIKYAKYMKAKMDTDKAKATYDKEIAQLQGWMNAKSVTKETQDVDTGKEALKAERDPMLERILNLAGR